MLTHETNIFFQMSQGKKNIIETQDNKNKSPSYEEGPSVDSAEKLARDVYKTNNHVWKIVENKKIALREFLIGQHLFSLEGFVPCMDLLIKTQYILKQKYIQGLTLAEEINRCLNSKLTKDLLIEIPKKLRQILFLLEKQNDVFTHYDLSMHNVLLQEDQIYLIDFEYSFHSSLQACPQTQACDIHITSVIQGSVTPVMYDPYIDVIVLMTSFFECWTSFASKEFKNHFHTLQQKCFHYFQTCGLDIRGDPRFLEKSRYLLTLEEWSILIENPAVKTIDSQQLTLPLFSIDSIQNLSFVDLCTELNNPKWNQDLDYKYGLSECIELCTLFYRFKKWKLQQITVSGSDFETQ